MPMFMMLLAVVHSSAHLMNADSVLGDADIDTVNAVTRSIYPKLCLGTAVRVCSPCSQMYIMVVKRCHITCEECNSSILFSPWAHIWINQLSLWCMAGAMSDPWLPSLPYSIAAFWPVSICTASLQSHMCMN